MNETVKIFEQVLEKFTFRQPMPPEARKAAFRNKRNALNTTLKYHGDYSVLYNMILRIYFFMKKSGIDISVLQSKIILLLISLMIIGSASAGIFLFYNIVSAQSNAAIENKHAVPPEPAVIKPAEKEKQSGAQRTEKENKSVIEYKKDDEIQASVINTRLGIEMFAGEADVALLNEITDNFSERLAEILGKDRIIDLRTGRKVKNINRLLTGSVERLGRTYIITSKIINVEDSKVNFIISREAKGIDQLDSASAEIIEKIAEQIK